VEFIKLEIEGSWVASSKIWSDDRGSFQEWFKQKEIQMITGVDFGVAQANLSISGRGVLRGIHYSLVEGGQAKWVTCVTGAIKDVIVDIRPNSPTFGKHIVIELSEGSGNAVLIGAGLGHGFVSKVENSTVAYLVSSPFSPSAEYEINPLDPKLSIDWDFPESELVLSPKDRIAPNLEQMKSSGLLPEH